MNRKLGSFIYQVVASPDYLAKAGMPLVPQDLLSHQCLHHRYPSTGKLEPWRLTENGEELPLDLPRTTIASTLEPLIHLAENGFGITCLPSFTIREQIKNGRLQPILENFQVSSNTFRVLWPTSRYLSPKVRSFVDFMATHLFPHNSQ